LFGANNGGAFKYSQKKSSDQFLIRYLVFQAIKLSLEEARSSSGFGAGGISQEEQARLVDRTFHYGS